MMVRQATHSLAQSEAVVILQAYVSMQGEKASKGWFPLTATRLDSAHKGLLAASAQRQPWQPGTSNVSMLLGRSTLQASCEVDSSRLLAPAAPPRRFTEQHPTCQAWGGSEARGPNRLGSSLGGLQWPQDRLALPQGQVDSAPHARHIWRQDESAKHQLSKHQALFLDSGKAHAKVTASWPGSDFSAPADKQPVHALKSRSFTSLTGSAPGLQVYRFGARQSQSALSSSKAGGAGEGAPVKGLRADRASFLIGTRYSEQSNTDWPVRQAELGLSSARLSLQMSDTAHPVRSQQQQQSDDRLQDSELYSAVSVQPRSLRPSLLTAGAAQIEAFMHQQSTMRQDDQATSNCKDKPDQAISSCCSPVRFAVGRSAGLSEASRHMAPAQATSGSQSAACQAAPKPDGVAASTKA